MIVRAARAEEAALLSELALRSKGYWGYDAAFLEACREELTLAPGEVAARRTRVAVQDREVVGFATLEGEPPVGVLGMLFVAPEAIGRGAGRLLFEDAAAQARALGFDRFTIDSDPHAEPFYRAMGAERVGSTPSGSIPGRMLPLLRYRTGCGPDGGRAEGRQVV